MPCRAGERWIGLRGGLFPMVILERQIEDKDLSTSTVPVDAVLRCLAKARTHKEELQSVYVPGDLTPMAR